MSTNDSDIIAEMEAQFKSTEFSAFMDDAMFEKFHTLREQMEDYQGLIQYKKGFQDVIKDRGDELAIMIRSLQETLDNARAQKKSIDDEHLRLTRELRRDDDKLQSLAREFTRFMAEIEARRKLTQQQDEMDLVTIETPWREKALPHQLEGAKRLAASGRAILGDAPGLG